MKTTTHAIHRNGSGMGACCATYTRIQSTSATIRRCTISDILAHHNRRHVLGGVIAVLPADATQRPLRLRKACRVNQRGDVVAAVKNAAAAMTRRNRLPFHLAARRLDLKRNVVDLVFAHGYFLNKLASAKAKSVTSWPLRVIACAPLPIVNENVSNMLVSTARPSATVGLPEIGAGVGTLGFSMSTAFQGGGAVGGVPGIVLAASDRMMSSFFDWFDAKFAARA